MFERAPSLESYNINKKRENKPSDSDKNKDDGLTLKDVPKLAAASLLGMTIAAGAIKTLESDKSLVENNFFKSKEKEHKKIKYRLFQEGF